MSGESSPPAPEGAGRLGRLMEADHRRLDDVWEQASSTYETDPAGSLKRYQEFQRGLIRHIAAEEELLFPFFESRGPAVARQFAEVLRQEHREIRTALDDLVEKSGAHAVGRSEAEERLRDLLGAHDAREEEVLYPWCDEPETATSAEELTRQVRARIAPPPRR